MNHVAGVTAYFMVDSRLTVLQSHTKSLRTARLLGLLHDIDAPQRLVVIWVHTHTFDICILVENFLFFSRIDSLISLTGQYQIFNKQLNRAPKANTDGGEFWFCFTNVSQCVRWLVRSVKNENIFLLSINGIFNEAHKLFSRSYSLISSFLPCPW